MSRWSHSRLRSSSKVFFKAVASPETTRNWCPQDHEIRYLQRVTLVPRLLIFSRAKLIVLGADKRLNALVSERKLQR